jgi:hypothetical protein
MLAHHPDASGLTNTGVYEDEGQHIQDVYAAANRYGGPGNFAFAPEMHLVEADAGTPAERAAKADRLVGCWAPHWDLSKKVLVEKSPPNVLKARYLQSLFPGAGFIMVTRHPIAVAEATVRWSRTSRFSLVAHWVKATEIMTDDLPFVDKAITLRYEDVVAAPQDEYAATLKWLGLEDDTTDETVNTGINEKYFQHWSTGGPIARRSARRATETFAQRVERLGYSMLPPYEDSQTGRD